MDIQLIRQRVQGGNYLVKSHAIQHAIKEDFERFHMVEAVLNGQIIEEYPDEQRVLICGHTNLVENLRIHLHIVCEYTDPNYVEFVTAYIPDGTQWENPPYRRRKRRR